MIPIETEYLPNVVPDESRPEDGFGTDALRAQAIAARTYAYHKIEYRPADQEYDVNNSVGNQLFLPNGKYVRHPDHARSDAAVRDTAGQYLYQDADPARRPIFAEFSADHSPKSTVVKARPFYTNAGDAPYLAAVYDPITNGEDNGGTKGHGRGLSQLGAKKWGRGSNSAGQPFPRWDSARILAHYFTGVQLFTPSSTATWPRARWNALHLSTRTFRTDDVDAITVQVQNSGATALPPGSQLTVRWQRCSTDEVWCVVLPDRFADSLTIPPAGLAPGTDTSALLFLRPPDNLYAGYAGHTYSLLWDVRLPDGRLLADAGWPEQDWRIDLHHTPPAPAPPPSRCGLALDVPCPLNLPDPTVSWGAVENPDPVEYLWTRSAASSPPLSGTTRTPSAAIPLLRGDNRITVQTRATTPYQSTSAAVLVARLLYDPDPPVLALSAPAWTNAASALVAWQGQDALSGLVGYTLSQQVDSGPWQVLLAQTSASQYQATTPEAGRAYTFRVTGQDAAGNTAVAQQAVRVDRQPPQSQLYAPTGTLTTSWALLRWQGTDDWAGVAAYELQVQVDGGAWQGWGGTISGTTQLVFVGQPHTHYAWRLRALDRAGNGEALPPAAELAFTTGDEARGLSRIYMPLAHQ